MVQDAMNRWWWPTLMMFGQSDHDSPNSAELMRWRIKLKSNDELRQKFVNQTVPKVFELGFSLPDDKLKYDEESKNRLFGEIDYEELKRVVSGHGPCNKERLTARIKAHEEGTWVREAAAAYSAKHQVFELLMLIRYLHWTF
jgi:ring-1,2-phenylacetyl-CoA epoxidase subunit PaaA